jgi:N-acetylglutamate synthase-like GNAT family acetyltransferase
LIVDLPKVFVKLVPGAEAAEKVNAFYQAHGGRALARDHDLFFLALDGETILGAVRYCVENDVPLLRSMMIDGSVRRGGLGTLLLKRFSTFLDETDARNVFCVPYAHLESFYQSVGFQKVREDSAPDFLQARLREYRQKPTEFILMMRP